MKILKTIAKLTLIAIVSFSLFSFRNINKSNHVTTCELNYYHESYTNGKLKSIHNKVTGYFEIYYEDGSIEEAGTFNNGIITGRFISFYPNGKIRREFHYDSRGKKTGYQVWYYESGAKQLEGMWMHGKITEDVVRYEDTGISIQ